ncbi:MAG: hypothetical protein V4729_14060 [Pseudomonadota bacterium]
MIAMTFFICIGLWLLVGVILWKKILRQGVSGNRISKGSAFYALIAAWLLVPFLDEIVGAKVFEEACERLPKSSFYGPIAVGEGPFFFKNGEPKWTYFYSDGPAKKRGPEDEVYVDAWNDAWRSSFVSRSERHLLKKWPIPIFEVRMTTIYRGSGEVIAVRYRRETKGGWLKRLVGFLGGATEGCLSRGGSPSDPFKWIKF